LQQDILTGTYPKYVQDAFLKFKARTERNVERWYRMDLEGELRKVRSLLATYLNTDDPDDLVMIPNTTSGMNAVFRSMKFDRGDQILYFVNAFRANKRLVQYIENESGGGVRNLEFPVNYPMTNQELVTNFASFLDAHHGADSPIRIAILEHVSSEPGLINPLEMLVPLLKQKGILVVIDGAHAIGHVPINLKALDVDYYITNCYKWLYSVRGSTVMYVKKEHQPFIHPAVISNFYAQPSNFQWEFFWTGAMDFSAYMSIPAAIEFRSKIGEDTLRNYTHNLAVAGGALVAGRLGTSVLQTEDQIGNMVDVALPILNPEDPLVGSPQFWAEALLNRFNMYVNTYKHNGRVWMRLCAQIYNELSDFQKAADAYKMIVDELNQKKCPVKGFPSDTDNESPFNIV